MRPCTACVHPERAVIDAALVEGISLRTVAARHGLSAGALHRHLTQHVDQPIVGEILEPDYVHPLWTRWNGTEWKLIMAPNRDDLIELRRPEHARYRQGYRWVSRKRPGMFLTPGYIFEHVRKVYRHRNWPVTGRRCRDGAE